MICSRNHAEPVDGCPSCRDVARSDAYRAALAKVRNQPPPAEKVGEPDRPAVARTLTGGPGTETHRMLADEYGIPACAACAEYARRMDAWGIDGCRERRSEIVARLENEAESIGWFRWVVAVKNAVAKGLPKDAAGIYEEAMRRAEEKAGRLDTPPAAG